MRRENGFTLIELLVVIAVIALLMGILMPTPLGIPGSAYRMSPNQLTRILLERHGRGINILFKGSHVQRVSLEKVCRYKWHRHFTTVAELDRKVGRASHSTSLRAGSRSPFGCG